jgi:sugar phosphate isomerase/epimerase
MTQPDPINDFSRLCLHTQTNRPWDLKQCLAESSKAGIYWISVWRHLLEGISVRDARRLIDDHGMNVVSLVRGGFFASQEASRRRNAIRDNLSAIEEARAIGAPLLVLVCGADPRQSLETSRKQIGEGIFEILPHAEEAGIRLAIEPLHPMYAADRSAITCMKQANDLAEMLHSDMVGVAVDLFHTWWDPDLQDQINRCGAMGKLYAFHVSDWKPAMADMLNDRGLMGEGCIPIKQIRSWMEEAGFTGVHEVEIFSEKYWSMDQNEYLNMIKQSYLKNT